ncbi:hypothetical protein [Arthrobacter sp. ISL-5]|uniref:hypothetical protein n=1 Tax=Arthrobacter sp. ISL-5 TaxID=2819111 RepID=UPI001BE9C224|nr:hypothetical protein [Arthrobacter sp. ISL-5]MBT2551831.1 hypothetical protein [Arthrobacter sp. ISL-5]
MNRAGTVPGQLHPQVVRPRPHQFENPDSYLARLCAANLIDGNYIRRLIQNRRFRTGRPDELAHVINELGGPDVGHFHREYARATAQPAPRLKDAFPSRQQKRAACSRCVGGEHIDTYDHRRFMICLKHNRWIGQHTTDQRQIIDYELRTVERRFRRIAATGLVPVGAHDAIIAAIDRHAPVLTDHLWLGHRPHGHPDIDRYPARVRILKTIADYLGTHWPLEREISTLHRRPEQARLYTHLRLDLAWLGAPAQTWKLIDELVDVVIGVLTNRTDRFLLSPTRS